MADGLKNKTLKALFWSFFERIGQQGIQFVISIILARLLLPEQPSATMLSYRKKTWVRAVKDILMPRLEK
jgi:hypothetical protein